MADAPLAGRAQAAAERRAAELGRERFRVSVLTYGGIHVVEVYGPDVDRGARFMAPALVASVGLLDALSKRAEVFRKEVGPTPPTPQ